jgi:hypothetical protein
MWRELQLAGDAFRLALLSVVFSEFGKDHFEGRG